MMNVDLLCKSMDWFLYDKDLPMKELKMAWHGANNRPKLIDQFQRNHSTLHHTDSEKQ